jgi:hypothetical protein
MEKGIHKAAEADGDGGDDEGKVQPQDTTGPSQEK